MVFGFGKGKIHLSLEKYSYMPGDTIKGAVTMRLKQPYEGAKLVVKLTGQRTTTSTSYGGIRNRSAVSKKTFKEKYYDFEQQIAGEKNYHQDIVKFEMKIPATILPTQQQQPKLEGAAKGLMSAANLLAGSSRSSDRISWNMRAELDIKGLNPSSRVQLTIG